MYCLYCSQFHTEFPAMNEHSLWIHISQLSHWTALWPFRTEHWKDHSQLYSLYDTKLRHQIQFLRVRCHQGLSMKRGRVFVLLAAASKTYIGSVLFWTSAYTDAKKASRVTFWFRDLSRQNHLVPFFLAGHLVPLFGSPRPVFYNGV